MKDAWFICGCEGCCDEAYVQGCGRQGDLLICIEVWEACTGRWDFGRLLGLWRVGYVRLLPVLQLPLWCTSKAAHSDLCLFTGRLWTLQGRAIFIFVFTGLETQKVFKIQTSVKKTVGALHKKMQVIFICASVTAKLYIFKRTMTFQLHPHYYIQPNHLWDDLWNRQKKQNPPNG